MYFSFSRSSPGPVKPSLLCKSGHLLRMSRTITNTYRADERRGTSYSFYSFVRKLGQTVAGAGAAGVLGVIGYDGKLAVQSPEVLTRLYDIATIVPAILLALIFVVLTFGYKLSKEQLDELHNVLRERREKAEAESK